MSTAIESSQEHIWKSDSALQCTWWSLTRYTLAVFVTINVFTTVTDFDRWFAHAVFYRDNSWIGAHVWFVNEVVHVAGTWFVRALVASGIATWIASYFHEPLEPARRVAAFFALSSILSVGVIDLLKELSNVPCPWSLREFGGARDYVHLFAAGSTNQPPGRCFPAAHASAGYCLLSLYFIGREFDKSLARAGLAMGIAAGVLFGFAQQSRGAHFFSHDVWSAFIVWSICSTLYVYGFRTRLWIARNDEAPVRRASPTSRPLATERDRT